MAPVRDDSFVAVEFAEALAHAASEIPKYRRRRAIIMYFGLEGEEPRTLQAIADLFRVSRERVRQLRNSAIDDLIYGSFAPSGPQSCRALVDSARDLVGRFEANALNILEVLEAGPAPTRGRAWAKLALRLAGKNAKTATKLVDEAARRQREALLASEADRRGRARRIRLAEADAARLAMFTSHALWPSRTRRDWRPDAFSAQREVGTGLGGAGAFVSRKLDRPVQYESGLELAFFMSLERSSSVIGYQEQPLRIEYAVEGVDHTYVPDVIAFFDDGRALVVEIKPPMQMGFMRNIRKSAALARWCGRNGAGMLIGDGRTSISEVLLAPCDEAFRSRLLRDLSRGPLDYFRYRLGAGQGRAMSELMAAIGSDLLAWQVAPFLLRLPTIDEASDARPFTKLLREHAPDESLGNGH